MSTTKSHSAKVAKPQDQTSASKVQALTEAILADQTTGLSDAIDAAVYNTAMFGSAVVKASGMPIGGSYTVGALSNDVNPVYRTPRPLPQITLEVLETHPVFQLTREQLRAAWLLQHGRRWVEDHSLLDDDDRFMIERLLAMGEMERYHASSWLTYVRIVE